MNSQIKHILRVALAAILPAMLAASCDDDDYKDGQEWYPSFENNFMFAGEHNIWFSNEGRDTEISGYPNGPECIYVGYSTGLDFTFDGVPEWLAFRSENNYDYDYDYGSYHERNVRWWAKDNPNATERIGIFKLTDVGGKCPAQEITATQYAAQPYLYLGENGNTSDVTISAVTAAAQEVKIEYFTNLITARLGAGDRYSSGNKIEGIRFGAYSDLTQKAYIYVKIPENTSSSVKTYDIFVQSDNGIWRYAKIKQNPATYSSDVSKLTVGCKAGTTTWNITCDVDWTAESDASWIKISPLYGKSGTSSVSVSLTENASANNRSGVITFKNSVGTNLFNVEVTQKGLTITVDGKSDPTLTLTNEGTARQVTVEADLDWAVTSKPDWITVSPTSGEAGKTQVNISAEKNETISNRRGKVVFGKAGSTVSCSLTVTEEGRPFGVGSEDVKAPWNGGTRKVGITTPGNWTASTSADWITVSPESGSGNAELSLTIAANTDEKSRTGEVKVVFKSTNATSQTKIITVSQDSQVFTVSGSSGKFDVNGGSVEVAYTSNVSAKAALSPADDANGGTDWVTVGHTAMPAEGEAIANKFSFTAAGNTSSKKRAVIADMKPEVWNQSTDKTYRIRLEQPGRSVATNVSRISFFSKGGQSETYSVTADGAYKIEFKGTKPMWLSLTQSYTSKSFHVVCAQNDEGVERSAILEISLLDLPSGESCTVEIPVKQYPDGTFIELDPWGHDIDWSPDKGANSVNISIDPWGTDKDWNL